MASLNDSSKRQPDGSSPSSEANPDVVMRTKFDYERQCYKHAELIARARLKSLQTAVQDAAKPASRSEGNDSPP